MPKYPSPPTATTSRRVPPRTRRIRLFAVHGPLALGLCERRPRPRAQHRVVRVGVVARAGAGAGAARLPRLSPRCVELLAQVCRHCVRGCHGSLLCGLYLAACIWWCRTEPRCQFAAFSTLVVRRCDGCTRRNPLEQDASIKEVQCFVWCLFRWWFDSSPVPHVVA
jgi:hypothetical protein